MGNFLWRKSFYFFLSRIRGDANRHFFSITTRVAMQLHRLPPCIDRLDTVASFALNSMLGTYGARTRSCPPLTREVVSSSVTRRGVRQWRYYPPDWLFVYWIVFSGTWNAAAVVAATVAMTSPAAMCTRYCRNQLLTSSEACWLMTGRPRLPAETKPLNWKSSRPARYCCHHWDSPSQLFPLRQDTDLRMGNQQTPGAVIE